MEAMQVGYLVDLQISQVFTLYSLLVFCVVGNFGKAIIPAETVWFNKVSLRFVVQSLECPSRGLPRGSFQEDDVRLS